MTISADEAISLLDTGEWMTDDNLTSLALEHLPDTWRARGYEVDLSSFTDSYVELSDAIVQFTRSRCDFQHVAQPVSQTADIRVGANAVFKIGPGLELLIRDGIGLGVSLFNPMSIFSLLRDGFKLKDLVKKFADLWERIDDPIEKQVFEGVCELGARIQVIDFDAQVVGNYEDAMGTLGPTAADISEYVNLDLAKLKEVLKALSDREVLSVRRSRWYVRF